LIRKFSMHRGPKEKGAGHFIEEPAEEGGKKAKNEERVGRMRNRGACGPIDPPSGRRRGNLPFRKKKRNSWTQQWSRCELRR